MDDYSLDAKRGPNVQELAAGGPKPEKEPEHPKMR